MSLNLNDRERSRILAVAILLAVFAAGAFGGAALALVFGGPRHRLMEREVFDVRRPGPPALPGDHEGALFLKTPAPLAAELDLDDAQRERVERLMEEQAQKAERLMAETEPRMKALIDSTNAAIEEVLTPEQRERFREIRERRRELIIRRFKIPEPPEPRVRTPASPPEPGE